MRLLTAENVARKVVIALRLAGHDVLDVQELRLRRSPDRSLVRLARDEHCVVITHDKDFLIQDQVSVVLLRFKNQRPNNAAVRLVAFLKSSLGRRLKRPTIVKLTETDVRFHRVG
jgi:predicted nuclease of predicted toxin-antitoxin system